MNSHFFVNLLREFVYLCRTDSSALYANEE